IALRAPSGLGNTNLTIRYNRFENADGTAYIGTPVNLGLTGPTSSNWYVYGNIFSYNAAESNGQPKAAGIFQIFSIKIAGDFSFYNNTISSLDNGPLASGSCRIIFATGSVNTRVEKLTVRNNIWYNCVDAIAPPGTGLSGLVTQIWDHNAYFATPLSGSGDPSALTARTIACILHRYPDAAISLLDYGREGLPILFRFRDSWIPIQFVNMRFSKKLYLPNNIAVLILLALALKFLPWRGIRKRII